MAAANIGTNWFHWYADFITIEPPRDKTNKMTCAPSKDLDQPGHPPSLIRVFAVHSMQGWAVEMLDITAVGIIYLRKKETQQNQM